jgi:aspartate 1-decarboxylase
MLRTIPHATYHRSKPAHRELHREASCGIDLGPLDSSGIRPTEQSDIDHAGRGRGFISSTHATTTGSAKASLRATAARRAGFGDWLPIAAFASASEERIDEPRQRLVLVDDKRPAKTLRPGFARPQAGGAVRSAR